MAGWGETRGPSAALVARREFETAARQVATSTPAELAAALDRLRAALAALDESDPAVISPGAYC